MNVGVSVWLLHAIDTSSKSKVLYYTGTDRIILSKVTSAPGNLGYT